jgi:8-oxo-dGTP pyrophosphatase MutT (NUDIX family)
MRLARLLHRAIRSWSWLTRPLTVGVRVILVREGQVLLVQHTYHDGWLLPGGGVKRGETLEAAARREAWEEVGAKLGALDLFGAFSNFKEYKSDHVAVFVCRDFTLAGQRPPSPEIAGCAFFSLTTLPEDLLPGHRRRLEEFQRPTRSPGFGLW